VWGGAYDGEVTNPPVVSKFRRLAGTHAAMVAGETATTVALAGSVLFSLDPDAARTKVLLYLGITLVPFLFIAPFIGPVIDRAPGGRRFVVQAVALARVPLSLLMASQVDSLLLFPLAFVALILQKTYAISRSALVPSVVSNESELVEANSKLSLIAGLVGLAAVGPAGLLQKLIGPGATLWYAAGFFALAFVAARRLPKQVVASEPAGGGERATLHARSVVLAASAMLFLRAAVGFTFFHLFFWYRRQDAGLVWFGLALAAATVMTMVANAVGPMVRSLVREETMMLGGLLVVVAAGLVAALVGGTVSGIVLSGAVNFGAAIGRLAFESIVQRDAPEANRGRAFAQFETRFQVGWVLAGVVPVLITMPDRVGFVFVMVIAAAATVLYAAGNRAIRRGRRRRPVRA